MFISEDLTKNRNNLFYRARQYRKDNLFKHVWTRDGNVTIRLFDDKIYFANNKTQLLRAVDIARAKASTPNRASASFRFGEQAAELEGEARDN